MADYSRNGFKITYPDFMKKKGDFPAFELENTKNITLYVFVHDSWATIRSLITDYNNTVVRYNNPVGYSTKCPNNSQITILRTGEYHKFPDSKQEATKRIYPNGSIDYSWDMLIPIGQRVISVWLSAEAENIEELENIWVPIFDSMGFDAAVIDKIPDQKPPIKSFNWTKVSDEKPKRHKISLLVENNLAALWDSGLEFYDEEGELEDAIDQTSVNRKFIKSDQKLFIIALTDPIEVPVELYFKAEPPDISNWNYVFEGLIETPTGTLCLGSGEPFIKIKALKGVYKFRVYLAGNSSDDDDESNEKWRIYLWPTDEKENNEVKTIKAP